MTEPPEFQAHVRQVTDSIWTFSRPFLRSNWFKIGGRSTAVRLSNGDVFLVSPTKPDDTTKATLDSIGKVKYLVAPDFEHHLFLKPYKDMYPDAQLIGVDGLPERKKEQGLVFDFVFDKNNLSKTFGPEGEIEAHYFPAHRNKEVAFLHKPTKTLIEADLMFNLPANEQYKDTGISPTSGLATQIFSFVLAPGGSFGTTLFWYLAGSSRDIMRRDVRIVSEWDFDRLIPCHGDVIETGAKAIWNKNFDRYLDHSHQS